MRTHCPQEGVFCDLFAGTNSVAAHFKRLGFQIISNDLLYLAYVFGRALIQNIVYELTFQQVNGISQRLTHQTCLMGEMCT